MKIRRIVMAVAVFSALGLSACGSSDTSSTSDTTIVNLELVPAGNVIDVRTAAEFSEGHVQGARNLDVQNGDFAAALETLDKSASYNVYCRSGNRSATAVEMMRNAGFTNVVDLGAVEDAAKTLALPIVTD
jgi:rhodanese-related sulfurtransferase